MFLLMFLLSRGAKRLSVHPSYAEVLHLVEQLTLEEQARLIVEVRERSQGFGMWQNRTDLADPELYVLRIREEDAKHATGEPKTPDEYLAEIEAWDE